MLLYTVLTGKDRASFRSRMTMVRTDGTGGVDSLSDGRSLDLTPSFSPDGSQIAFASDRFGKRLSICTMSASGAPGTRQLTAGDNNVLWPSIDSEPQPRLFYQAMVDSYAFPRLWESEIGRTIRSDLTQSGGVQPRISPRDDSLVFVGVNEKTNKREIYRVSDKGGVPENLTNTPDDDEYDPAWSRDGSKIAFVAERSGDSVGSADVGNADIWVLDLKSMDKPMQITSNASIDDHPVWDPSGNFIYFRSNRGGGWGIWKIALR
jgi:Tol biopolymer transport system component